MRRLFISDLHLDESRSDLTAALASFLSDECSGCDELYVLGDLFNFWISDSEKTPFQEEIAALFRKCPAKKIFFQRGNRDFLVGRKYCRRARMKLLPDAKIIKIGNERALLCHGDEFCTLDKGYQRFKKFRDNRFYRLIFALLPFSVKQSIAGRVRSDSGSGKTVKTPEMMDVVKNDVIAGMIKRKATLLIHGHTHKPDIHVYESEGLKRIVLGDWRDDGFAYLEENDGNLELKRKTSSDCPEQ